VNSLFCWHVDDAVANDGRECRALRVAAQSRRSLVRDAAHSAGFIHYKNDNDNSMLMMILEMSKVGSVTVLFKVLVALVALSGTVC